MKILIDQSISIVVYSALAVTGLLGNVWVLMTVSTQLIGCASPHARGYKSVVQSSAYIYLLLLSIVDLLSLIPVPMLVTDIFVNHFPFGVAMCKLFFMCEGMNKTLSPLILTALSVDRYIAVCHPTLHWMRSGQFSLLVVTVCLVFSLGFIIPITSSAEISFMKDNNAKEISKCAMREFPYLFEMLHTIICYVMPLIVICAVYLAILRKLYVHTRFSTVGHKTSISLSRVVKCSVMVVAFYFICWTPYWTMRIHYLLTSDEGGPLMNMTYENTGEKMLAMSNDVPPTEAVPDDTIQFFFDAFILMLYLLHALPYAQSAFNWLFYAFLNRNLRNSTVRCTNGTRSGATSTVLDNGAPTMSTGFTPIWKNIQQMGTQIKSAGIDTGNALLKMSPFRSRSRIQSRSSTYLECSDQLVPPGPGLSSSMLDIPRRPSLIPRQEPSLAGKALSYSNLPHFHVIDQKEESSHGLSESSSVEWL